MEEEKEILKEIGRGNQKAFELLFRSYYDALCRFAYSYLKDADDAEEIAQDVLVKLWENRSKIETIQNVKSYLFRSVSNRCLNNIKHEKIKQVHRVEVLSTNTAYTTGTHTLEKKELDEKILKALEEIPTQCRKVFELSRFQELSYKEISDVLNISVKTVENHIGKALKIMRSKLSDYLTIVLVLLLYSNYLIILIGVSILSVVQNIIVT